MSQAPPPQGPYLATCQIGPPPSLYPYPFSAPQPRYNLDG